MSELCDGGQRCDVVAVERYAICDMRYAGLLRNLLESRVSWCMVRGAWCVIAARSSWLLALGSWLLAREMGLGWSARRTRGMRQIAIRDLVQSHDTPNQAIVCDLASAHQLGSSGSLGRCGSGGRGQCIAAKGDTESLGEEMGMGMEVGMEVGMEMGMGWTWGWRRRWGWGWA